MAERRPSECVHCGAILSDGPEDRNHWRECPSHPAKEFIVLADQRQARIVDLEALLDEARGFINRATSTNYLFGKSSADTMVDRIEQTLGLPSTNRGGP